MLPDEPRWVEANGIAGDPRGWRRELPNGFALGHDVAKLIVVGGEPDLVELAREFPHHTLLITTNADALRPSRTPVRAILHTLPDPTTLPDYEGAALLPADAALDHLPAPLAAELAEAKTIWTSSVDGQYVAFAYAPWRSEKYFDVSVDVLPGARQLGLGTIVAATLIHAERAAGREPVWGADEDNHASLRLAARLGFVECDRIWVAPP